MKNYQFISKNEIDDKEWDQLVNESPDGWLYQTSAWINLAQRRGADSLSFGVFDRNKILVGIFPLYRDDLLVRRVLRLRRFQTGEGGPAMSLELSSKQRIKLWKAMFTYVDQIADLAKIDLLEVRITTLAPSYLPPRRQDVNPLFSVGCVSPLTLGKSVGAVQPVTRMLYLDKPEEQLLMEMDTNCRAAVRQGERNGLKFVENNSTDSLKAYLSLHDESWDRTGLIPHSFKYFEDMRDALLPTNSVKFFFVVHEGREIAAVVIHIYKEGAYYWAGCSATDSLKLRPNNFLLWNVAKWAKRNELRHFEIGQYYPFPTGDAKEYAVGKYKAHFGVDELVSYNGQKIYKTRTFLILSILRSMKVMLKRLLKKFPISPNLVRK